MRADWFLVLAAVSAAWSFVTLAWADDPKARASEIFHEASRAYDRGQFAAAASGFEESDRLVPRSAALYNAGVAWEAAGDPARAANDYDTALDRGELAPDQAADARKQLDALERKLGRLDVLAPPDARIVVGVVEGHGPRLHLHVEPGAHDVLVTTADGRAERRTIDARAGEVATVRFEDRPGPVPQPPLGPSTRTPRQQSPPAVPSGRPTASPLRPGGGVSGPVISHPPSHPERTVAWVALGTAVAFSGAAIVFGVKTLDSLHSFESSDELDASAHDNAVRYRLLTNIALGAAGAVALLGGTLLVVSFTGSRETRQAGLAVEAGLGSVALRWRY
jgi:hypothetical protein